MIDSFRFSQQLFRGLWGYASFVLVASVAQSGPFFGVDQDPLGEAKTWQKVEELSDEFEQTDGIDRSKWLTKPVIPEKGWGWIGRPPGLFIEEAISIADGRLKVEANILDKPIEKDGKRFTHTGAIVRSSHPCQVGWYYECKMKANQTFMSSTFWMMTREDADPKKLELDVQECVGVLTPDAAEWAKKDRWDQIFHSNAFHRSSPSNPVQTRDQAAFHFGADGEEATKNHERYFVYGFWWKSPTELMFYMDGEFKYKIENPPTTFDIPMYLHMVVETYDWNPPPLDGGMVGLSKEQRSTQYEWVRTWKVVDD